MEYKQEYIYLGIALAGVYAKGRTKVTENSVTTFNSSIPDNRLYPYYGNLVEGGVIVDKRTCQECDVVVMAVNGPILKDELPAGHKQSLFDPPTPCSDPTECKGFDYISMDLYLKLWRGLGAKIGERRGNLIQWENGHTEDIPPFEKRFEAQV